MSRQSACVLAVALVCAGVLGCAVPGSFSGYLENRRQDLIDVLHVDFSAVNVGAVAYVGPFLAGINYMTGVETREQSTTLQLGLGGARILGRKGLATGLLWPSSRWNEDSQIIGRRPKRAPSGFSVGFSVGAVAGIGAEADALELIDFVLGLFCVDLAEDDEDIGDEPEPEPAGDPPPEE